jgi:hypothetical protein
VSTLRNALRKLAISPVGEIAYAND